MYDGSCLPDKGISEGRGTGKSPTMNNCVYNLAICLREIGLLHARKGSL